MSATGILSLLGADITSASAQTTCATVICANQVALLSPFQNLLNTAQGQAFLQADLQTVIGIYQNATAAQQNTANINAQDPFNSGYITGNLWQMTNNPISAAMQNIGYSAMMTGSSQYQNLSNLISLTVSTDAINELKDIFALSNIYGQAYNNSAQQDPRPFQVAPQIGGAPWATQLPPGPYPNIPAGDVETQQEGWAGLVTSPSFPSGHSIAGYNAGLLYAILLPEYYQTMVQAAQEFGLSRNIIGAHYPSDVIGSRIAATYNLVQWLSNSTALQGSTSQENIAAFPDLLRNASNELRTALGVVQPPYANCAADVAGCIAAGVFPTAAQFTAANQAYISSITYDLPSVGSTTDAPIVPENAYLLLAARFPYLSPAQITDILATTELPSGVPLDDHLTGWARLNLYAAAGGYGQFNSAITVDMNASQGGFNSIDLWSNNISGAGSLTKLGTGTLILGGTNTYTGGTTVGGGTLALTGSLIGDLTVQSEGIFVTAGGYQVNSGSTLTNQGLFLSVNSTLISQGLISNSGTLQSPVANYGTMTNAAGGSMNGRIANYGLFSNNGMVNGEVTNAGILKGTGLIVGRLVNNGILAPGNSIGTLSVTGPVVFSPSSTYQAEIGGSGVSDMLTVDGPLALGGTLQLVQTTGGVPVAWSFDLLSATDGFSGGFSAVQVYDASGDLYPFLGADFSTSGNTLTATVAPAMANFAAWRGTANQQAVGGALSTLSPASPIIDAAMDLTAPYVPGAFNALSGEAYPSTSSLIQQQSVYVREAVGARLRQSVTASRATPLAYAAKAAGPETAALGGGLTPTLWAQGYGGWGDTFSNGNAASLSNSIGGFLIGADVAVMPNARMGIFGGFSQSQFDVDARASSGTMDNYDLGLYGAAQFAGLALRGGLSYTWHDVSVDRTVAFPGMFQSLSAGYTTGTTQVFGEVGYDVAAGAYAFEPFVGFAYVATNGANFSETGGSAGLNVDIAAFDTVYTTLGVRAATTVQVMGATLTPNVSVGWQHAFGDTDPTASMLFQGGATPFQISGVPIAEDALMLGAGLSYALSDVASLSVTYNGQLAATASQNAFTAQFALKF